MALYTLHAFDLTQIGTTAATLSDNGGYQFAIGTDTVTIAPGATAQALSVSDTGNATFDDDVGAGQTLDGAQTINGTTYPGGTIVESEYEIDVRDSLGTVYRLQFISVNDDAYNIRAFVIQGAAPPFGEALTVVGRHDMTTGVNAYATSSDACFGPDARIRLATGTERRVIELLPGDPVALADGGTARVEMVLPFRSEAAGIVRLRADALVPGVPTRGLVLSGQHRVWLRDADALVAAKALTCLPRIGLERQAITLVHLVLHRHALVYANGLICESFWPGPRALAALPDAVRRKVLRIMGPNPVPARPFLTVREGRRLLAERHQAA